MSSNNMEFEAISFESALKLTQHLHASHCMLWSTEDDVHYALMQVRFDGRLGFPGGEVDEAVSSETVLAATTRELVEEINYSGSSVVGDEWVCSYRASTGGVLHFFAKQLSPQELSHLEQHHWQAEHFPKESLGLFRVPLGQRGHDTWKAARRFLANFLGNRFAGSAKLELIEAAKKLSLIGAEDLQWICQQKLNELS